jgi:hypothetical protein
MAINNTNTISTKLGSVSSTYIRLNIMLGDSNVVTIIPEIYASKADYQAKDPMINHMVNFNFENIDSYTVTSSDLIGECHTEFKNQLMIWNPTWDALKLETVDLV